MLLRRILVWTLSLALTIGHGPAVASQNTLQMPTSGTISGLQFSNLVTDALDSLVTCNSGASAPVNAAGGVAKAGQCWIDTTTASALKKYRYSGSAWVLEGIIDVTNAIWTPPVGGGSASLASAATTSVCGVPQSYITITGTTTITSFGVGCPAGQIKILKFSQSLTITYNATSLLVPGLKDIVAEPGDTAILVNEGSGNWRIAVFSPASGQALTNPAVPVGTKLDFFGGSVPTKYVHAYGQPLSRASYPDWLAAATIAQSGSRTSGSPIISGLTSTLRLGPGMPVEGAGIPLSTTIVSVDSDTQITISANATSTGTATVSIFLYGYGVGGDSTTVGVPDCQGRMVAGRDNMSGNVSGRVTVAGSGIPGTQIGASGGSQTKLIAQPNLPNVSPTISINDPGHSHIQKVVSAGGPDLLTASTTGGGIQNSAGSTASSTTGITATSSSINGGVTQTAMSIMPPVLIADCIVRVQP